MAHETHSLVKDAVLAEEGDTLVQLRGNTFFDMPDDDPFLPASAGDQSVFDLLGYGILGETLKGIHPRMDEVIKPGIAAITTPGHTPGHQSLMIMLPSERAMILTGDAMMCPANLDPALPPGNAHTTEHAVASIQRLKALADFHDGELVICHDPALWEKWKPAPHAYA